MNFTLYGIKVANPPRELLIEIESRMRFNSMLDCIVYDRAYSLETGELTMVSVCIDQNKYYNFTYRPEDGLLYYNNIKTIDRANDQFILTGAL